MKQNLQLETFEVTTKTGEVKIGSFQAHASVVPFNDKIGGGYRPTKGCTDLSQPRMVLLFLL